MTDDRLSTAVLKLEQVASALAARPAATGGDAMLSEKHAALRAAVEEAVGALDALLLEFGQ